MAKFGKNTFRLFGPVLILLLLPGLLAMQPETYIVINIYESGTLNATVNPGQTQIFAIQVPHNDYLADINVRVRFTHYNVGCWDNPGSSGRIDEVGLRIQDPATGTWVRLKGNDGGIGEVFDGTFDDSAADLPGFTVNCSSLTGTFHPVEPLSVYKSHPINGYWILEVENGYGNCCDTGRSMVLNDWSMTITHGSDVYPPTWGDGMIFSATDTGKGGKVKLTWSAASDYSPPISYNIYWATTSGGQNFSTPNAHTTNTQYTASGLNNRQMYYFVVRAVDTFGNEDTNINERAATPTAPDVPASRMLLLD